MTYQKIDPQYTEQNIKRPKLLISISIFYFYAWHKIFFRDNGYHLCYLLSLTITASRNLPSHRRRSLWTAHHVKVKDTLKSICMPTDLPRMYANVVTAESSGPSPETIWKSSSQRAAKGCRRILILSVPRARRCCVLRRIWTHSNSTRKSRNVTTAGQSVPLHMIR